MTTASTYLAPLITAYRTALAGLPVAQQAAVQCSIGIEVTDSHERWQLTANGADVSVSDGIAESVDFRVYATKARIDQFVQDNGISFLLRPITTGRIVPFKALRGTLRLALAEGDEYKIVFGGAAVPEAIMRMKQQDAIGLLTGTLNAQAAVFSGRIRIDGGMSFLMSLERFV